MKVSPLGTFIAVLLPELLSVSAACLPSTTGYSRNNQAREALKIKLLLDKVWTFSWDVLERENKGNTWCQLGMTREGSLISPNDISKPQVLSFMCFLCNSLISHANSKLNTLTCCKKANISSIYNSQSIWPVKHGMLLGFILGFKMQKRSFITLGFRIDKTIFNISMYGVESYQNG